MDNDNTNPSLEEEPILSESEYAWIFDHEANAKDVLEEKLRDLETPGLIVEFSPEEADLLGAFTEDALSEEDALRSIIDLPESLQHAAKLAVRED